MSPASPKLWIAISLLVALSALGWVALGSIGENLVYYWTPQELLSKGDAAKDAVVRLGGLVKAGSVQWQPGDRELRFVVALDGHEVPVRATEMPPQMFREGIGVVVEGRLDAGGTFVSDRLLVKHDNEYRAPADERGVDVAELAKTVSPAP
jgi:cytochrome c-type biogenesis protein CcmE